jgi:hypothetical protein
MSSYSPEFANFIAEMKGRLIVIENTKNNYQQKSNLIQNVFDYIVNSKSTITQEIVNFSDDANERQKRFLKLLTTFYEKSIEMHNEMIRLNVGSIDKIQTCGNLEKMVKNMLITLLNVSKHDNLFDLYLVKSPYVRRSARLAIKASNIKASNHGASAIKPGSAFPYDNIELFFNPYDHIPPLRRSARLAAKAK